MKKFQHKVTLPAILTLLVLAIAFLFIGFFNLKRETTLPNNSNTSSIGIQLNQNFDYVDLHQLQQKGVSFVYLRSTQGKSYFDDNFLSYRDQIQGTKLAYGTTVYFSDQSTPTEQYDFFEKKVGNQTGSLPIMVIPTSALTNKYLKQMAQFTQKLEASGKKVMVMVDYRYHNFFSSQTQFATSSVEQPDKLKYTFWRYTNNGRVKDVQGLEKGVTMYSYNGTVTQYKQKYGQLTQ